ncbi:MAG TPA: OmpA family protein [Thermoanaerobaculia bacterium]|nr:OmpA family protein [Thermoanaerobaculia bacterium]HUM31192.1 OmpA family protein [Thermoanaerobaculia bacterium]HXK69572.1 OmpA family protein [Thermoanaerobaculia bacterium]
MKKMVALSFIVTVMLSCFTLVFALEADFRGSKDHPLLSRMPDFYISDYKSFDFDTYRFNDQEKKYVVVEGQKIYMEYKLNKGAVEPGELKIRRNIQDALKKIGGKVVFDDNFNKCSTIVVQKDGNEIWVEVKSYNNMYRLTTVIKKSMDQEVVADAEAMGNDIKTSGHVSIYGIYFDTGKSVIKPESDAAILEIAKLLKADTALKVYVVGHTDSDGTLDFNMKLSKDRAEAVARALVDTHGIGPDRLKAFGVASLAPVASNGTEEGKQKNRRVELVKQ